MVKWFVKMHRSKRKGGKRGKGVHGMRKELTMDLKVGKRGRKVVNRLVEILA